MKALHPFLTLVRNRPLDDFYVISNFKWCIQKPIKYQRWNILLNGFKLLTVFAKLSISDVWQGPEYVTKFIARHCISTV